MSLNSNDKPTIHIALCVNQLWAKYIETIVYSLSKHNLAYQIHVHLIYSDLTASSVSRLYQLNCLLTNVQLEFCHIEESVINKISVENYYLPLETYYRFLLPTLLPNINRVIYLDVDILICGDLYQLYQVDLGDSCIAAAHEKDNAVFFPEHAINLGIETDRYFNAGVLVLDLEKMRERQLSQVLIDEAAEKVDELRFGDQDLLNVYFKEEVVMLDERYNYTYYRMRYENRPLEELSILHYNGPIKPWFSEPEYHGEYMKHLSLYKIYQLEYQELLIDKLLRRNMMLAKD